MCLEWMLADCANQAFHYLQHHYYFLIDSTILCEHVAVLN